MLRSSMRSPRSRGGFRARALPAAAVAVLMLGLASCGDSEQEEPTAAPVSTSSSSDGGGEAADGRGDASDGAGDSGKNEEDGVAGTAAPEASDGGGNRITMTKDDFPPPNPADYPGMNTHTEQGAIATAKYYWNAFYWASWTGEFTYMNKVASEGCSGCESLSDIASESYVNQVYLTPSYAYMQPDTAQLKKDTLGHEYVVIVNVEEYVTAKNLKGREDHVEAAHGLDWTGSGWQISELEYRPIEDGVADGS